MATPAPNAAGSPRPGGSVSVGVSSRASPGPFTLTPQVFEKVWGGRRLERLGKALPRAGARYGESWELADMGSTSASGAGGGSVRTLIADGPLAGRTLHDAVGVWGADLLGGRAPTAGGDFPLLVKFLDACENLSVQVHPSPAYAARHAGANLKTECWYILDAEPGSVIYKGLKAGVSREAFAARCRARDAGLVNDLVATPAVPGECHNLPSGTVHALGAGVLVAEVQTPSDTTYRLYDWGRTGRELHVEQSLACCLGDEPPAPTRIGADGRRTRLVTTEFFTLSGLELGAAGSGPGAEAAVMDDGAGAGRGAAVVIAIGGAGRIVTPGQPDLAITLGQTVVVPAACAGARVASEGPLRVLIAGV